MNFYVNYTSIKLLLKKEDINKLVLLREMAGLGQEIYM